MGSLALPLLCVIDIAKNGWWHVNQASRIHDKPLQYKLAIYNFVLPILMNLMNVQYKRLMIGNVAPHWISAAQKVRTKLCSLQSFTHESLVEGGLHTAVSNYLYFLLKLYSMNDPASNEQNSRRKCVSNNTSQQDRSTVKIQRFVPFCLFYGPWHMMYMICEWKWW